MIGSSALAASFYIGTYTHDSDSQGIYHGEFDSETGRIGHLHLAANAPDPSFLALSPDGKFLYAALEGATAAAAAFRVEAGGKLAVLNRQPSGGADPCHVSVDRAGKFLFVANYTGGSIAAFAIKPDGSLGKRTAFAQFRGSGPDPARQTSPHAHAIAASPDNRFVYVCDLGTDKIWIFRFDAKTGALIPAEPAFSSTPAGSGPRHFAFSNDGKFACAANEMGLDVTVFRRDTETGALQALQTTPAHFTPPLEGSSLSEIELHPSGKWLYVSSRKDDTLAVFAVAPDGTLRLVENISSGVKIPRGFAIDPTGGWLLVAGQNDNRLRVFRIDHATGRLELTGNSAIVARPVCILFAK